jgi:ubiquinone/menaquinone biosynthesis C-methylase UbiE
MWRQFSGFTFLLHDVDAAALPFPNEYFRTIIATNLLEHVFDVFGLLGEIARVLEPDGTCLISVPNISAWRHVISLIRGRVPRTGAIEYPFNVESGWDGQHLHQFTHSELRWLGDNFGLSTIATLATGRLPWMKRLLPRYLSSSVDLVLKKV